MPGWGFGQGGVPNVLPGRGYPQAGQIVFKDDPSHFIGGARGPAALPSRTTVSDGPAMPEHLVGPFGQVPLHRGAFVEDAGAPRLEFDNVLGHGSVPWSRPVYPNVAGLHGFHAPTQLPSWTANSVAEPDRPMVAVPVSKKRIDNFTVRRPFGDTSSGQLFRNGSLADVVAAIPTGWAQQGRRWMRQSKTANPHLVNRSTYSTAGSYGQTTSTLMTVPANVPASTFGAY